MVYTDSWELLQRVKDRLSDEATTFGDEELMRQLAAAVVEYSRFRPYRKTHSFSTVVDQAYYDLPTDCVEVISCSWGTDLSEVFDDDTFYYLRALEVHDLPLDRRNIDLYTRYQEIGQGTWEPFNGQLHLLPTPSEILTVSLIYGAVHAKTGDNYTTVPLVDLRHVEDLLMAHCLYALADELNKMPSYNEGQTQVEHNPEFYRRRAVALESHVHMALGNEGRAVMRA